MVELMSVAAFGFSDARELLVLGTAFYAIAVAYAITYMLMAKAHKLLIFYTLLTAGFAFQSFGLYQRGLDNQSFPLHNTFEILQVIAWSAMMIEFVMRPAFRIRLLGLFTGGLAALLTIASVTSPNFDHAVERLHDPINPWVSFHAVLAVFSYGVFAILCMTSIMYLLQHYALRDKRMGGLFSRLPSVKQLDDINKRLLLMGVSVLSIAIAIGFANLVNNPQGVGVQKLFAALFVWGAYLVVYRMRVRKRLIASHFAWACLFLFVMALVSLWSLNKNSDKLASGANVTMQDDAR